MSELDPLSFRILWGRLVGVVEEAGAILRHSAFSSIVSEGNDCTAVLFDASGRELAEPVSFTATSFIGTIPQTMKIFLQRHPPESWHPGDVLICNDPWICTGHLFDICMAVPIFHRNNLIAFSVTCSHTTNIGGSGSSAQSIFEEGLQIPICWLYKDGVAQDGIFDFIAANVPMPEQVLGDIRAQVNANTTTTRRVIEIVEELGLDDLQPMASMIHRTCAAAMRSAILTLPSGRYSYELPLGDASNLVIRCALNIPGDGSLSFDYGGSSPQVKKPINSPIHYTLARTYYALKAVLLPSTPGNAATFSMVDVAAPHGTIVNPERPFPTASRAVVGHFVPAAVMGVLGRAVPDRVLAEGAGASWSLNVNGEMADGKHFYSHFPLGCGQGGAAIRVGMDAVTYPGNPANAPIEVAERQSPLRFEQKSLRRTSGGQGMSRGGWGQTITVRLAGSKPANASVSGGRTTIPASGLAGGGTGEVGRVMLNGEVVEPNRRFSLKPDDRLILETPGGGGYGPKP